MGFLTIGAVVLSLQSTLQAALALSTGDVFARADKFVVNETDCDNRHYTYQQLAGYGFVPNNARDKYGDTLGGFGSAAAIDRKTWTKNKGVYTGILWALPDRGWYGHVHSRRSQQIMSKADFAVKEHEWYSELSDPDSQIWNHFHAESRRYSCQPFSPKLAAEILGHHFIHWPRW